MRFAPTFSRVENSTGGFPVGSKILNSPVTTPSLTGTLKNAQTTSREGRPFPPPNTLTAIQTLVEYIIVTGFY